MQTMPRAAGLACGLAAALGIAATAQQAPAPDGATGQRPPAASASAAPGKPLVIQGTIKFFEESDVASLRDGVIKQIEYNVGDFVKEGEPIAYLHDEMAKLKVARQKVAAESQGGLTRARAQKELAIADLAIRQNLVRLGRDMVPAEEMNQYRARALVAEADVLQATDELNLAARELDLANQELKEHIVTAPFSGFITNRMKDKGERVQSNEPVLRMGQVDKLRFFGYLPLQSAGSVSIGDLVEVSPEVPDAELEIEKQVYRGNVMAVVPEVTAVGRTEVQILAEISNPVDLESPKIGQRMLAGMKGRMTVYVGTAGKAPAQAPVASQPAALGSTAASPLAGTR